MKNKYCYRSRISEAKFREIIKYFSLDLEAEKIAQLTNISRPTINKIVTKIREIIAEESEKATRESGVFEVDESYFGAKRVRGKRGRGAKGKTIVFGLLKRDGKVYTQIIQNVSRKEIIPIIKGKILEGSTVNSDGWKSYDSLILNGYTHHRVYHSKDEFARGKSHINGIENFWGIAKVRLAKFRGIHKSHFYLHLKESEFRFNYRYQNIYAIILKLLRNNPLNLS
ncbi:IS1595 family transposase [Candidatus Peribacteria bacterium]|nr:IS1595 family transposase [Candidatus Peribacteria bacterium]